MQMIRAFVRIHPDNLIMRFPRMLALAIPVTLSLSSPATAKRAPLGARVRAINAQKRFTPGSTTTLVTTGTALGVLAATAGEGR
jgi:hypothetical protein